mgnify:CR=1 FL=1
MFAMMDLSLATQRTFKMLTCKKRIFCQVFVGDKGYSKGPFDSFLPLLIDKGSKLILYIQA